MKTVHAHIDAKTGRFRTEWEVEQDQAAEEAKKFKEASEKPYYIARDEYVDDWSGHKYVTTHQCFGRPCKKDENALVQLNSEDFKTGTFNLGDL